MIDVLLAQNTEIRETCIINSWGKNVINSNEGLRRVTLSFSRCVLVLSTVSFQDQEITSLPFKLSHSHMLVFNTRIIPTKPNATPYGG